MMVPSQEMATFLGNHLDQVLQQSSQVFLKTVAAVQPFGAGCALMDVLNRVELAQDRIRTQLEEKNRKTQNKNDIGTEVVKVRVVSLYLLYSLYSHLPIHQNPFLCFFVDIYTSALQDNLQPSERFVVSVILTGDGEELAPSSPSELMAIAQEVDPRHVDLTLLHDILPKVPAGEQVLLGMSWSDYKLDSRDAQCPRWKSLDLSDWLAHSGAGEDGTNGEQTLNEQELISDDKPEDSEEGELEEWEIEAEKHFQESEDAIPAPPKPASKPKNTIEPVMSRHNINLIMEQAVIQPLSFEEEQFMLSQFAVDADKVHIPLPPTDAISGIVDNNPTIAFNLLLYLIQLSKEMGLADVPANGGAGKAGSKGATSYPEPSMVDVYLDTMIHTKRLTLHSLEVVNRLTTATTVSPRFLHGYIENAVRCCELVEDKVGQARVVRMLCVFLQSLLRNNVITIPGYFHALQNFCIQFSRVKEVAALFQTLVEYQRKMDAQSPSHHTPPMPPPTVRTGFPGQSASVPSTPTTESSQRASWLANSGSISHIKTSLNKHNSMNGFSSPGALSQFIHPGPSSPAAGGQNGGGSGGSFAFGQSNGSGLYIKTHHKHSSQHSSASGSLFSSPTVMSASVNAFNTGLGNPTSLTLNGSSSSNNNSQHSNGGQGPSSSSSQRTFAGSSWGQSHETVSEFDDEDLEAALRASLKDVEVHSQNGSSSSFSSKSRLGGQDQGSGTASSTLQTPDNGLVNPNDRTRRRVVASTGTGRREKTDGPRNRMVPLKNRNS
ncbi:hypothetical protein EMPS_06895 [Entomortierella parvispora]|uniref:CCR4-NOT transcription complex subunit 11 n=1 Tax=Entomortierella parvispora TaxID=205924 RepID=A0A9P3HDV2_9FUNG|nr:hypothetical protein EMPS_06895 [Entomortierella parvispora]